MLPFTIDQFFDVFEQYNSDIPYAGTVLAAIACIAVAAAIVKKARTTGVISLTLAVMWAWTALIYHFFYFAAINPAAYLFGSMFLSQSAIFVVIAVGSSEIRFGFRKDIYGGLGAIIILYALIIYPVLGSVVGHDFPRKPSFGMPCPLTIFTLGILFWSARPLPWWILAIPVIWAIIGSFAAILFGVWEDLGLLAAAIVLVLTNEIHRRRNMLWSTGR